MKSPGSYTRSAARATFSAYKSLPIRWRLAGGSAVLTLVILASFAAIVGALTTRQVRAQFNDEVRSAADQLQKGLDRRLSYDNGLLSNCFRTVRLSDYARAEHAQIRIFDPGSGDLLCTQDKVKIKGTKSLPATPQFPMPLGTGTVREFGYRVEVRDLNVEPSGQVVLLYARPLSDVDHTLARVQFFLLLGVLGGTFLALAGRAGHRAAGHASDRRADRGGARDRAHARPQPAPPPPRGQRRDRRAGEHAGGDARRAGRRPR